MRAPFPGGGGTENLDWYPILSSLGIDVPENPRRHGPCPICGGKDRFRFDNRNEEGTWYCNQGGSEHRSGKTAGNGAALVAEFFDIGYRAALEKIRGISREPSGVQTLREKCASSVPPVDLSSQRKIQRLIKDSVRLDDIAPGSRIILQAGKVAVEKYLVSRGLPLLFPAESRILVQPDGYDLIIPLTCDRNDILSLHVTALTRDGRKRPLPWTGGSCRYTLGALTRSYSSISGAEEQISVSSFPGVRFYAIGEGLETVLSGRSLSGWSSIFAVNANGIRTFLDDPETVKTFRSSGAGLAILVDMDKSETGQKASVVLARKAKEARIPVLFLLPPHLIKGGEKGTDWNDAVVELGKEGARAALMIAISRSEETFSKIEIGKALPIDRIRDSDGPIPSPVERVSLEEATGEVRKLILDHWKIAKPSLGAIDAGVGKSRVLADLSWDHQIEGAPLLTISPTRALAEEASVKGGGLFREGRTDDPERAGFCPVFPEVVPFSEKWRSVVAHKCHDCPNGKAAMDILKGSAETPNPDVQSCAHILHIQNAKISSVVTSTAAMLEGDPGLPFWKSGDVTFSRRITLDDTAELNDHRRIHGGHVSEWIRAANHAIRHDQAKIAFGETDDGTESRKERIEATEALIPHLEVLAHLLSENPGEEQIRLAPEDWKDFSRLAQSSKIRWMDGISAEAIYRDREGTLEIPLRTLKSLGEALDRGTAWVRKSVLHFASPTKAFKAIQNRALVLDATPSLAVRQIVEALGGNVTEIRVQQPSLVVRQVASGSHGKTACLPDSPSFEREKSRFLSVVNNAVEKYGAENIAVLSHKSFVGAVSEEIPGGVEVGWWGCHNRGLNDWETKTHIVVWGIQQLSPSVAEREYMADRQAVIEAGGTAWPEWNGARGEKWYGIPGQAKEIHATGYQDEFIDIWGRERTTAEVVQAVGRLRAVRRPGEALTVEIHSTFPFAEVFGLEIHELIRPNWRTMSDYQAERKTGQIEKGIIAFHATGGGGRRLANEWLKEHGLEGIKPASWPELKEIASGSRHEYSLFASGTTPDLFGKDVRLLIEALDRLAVYAAEEGMMLTELAKVGLVDPDPLEWVALEVLRVSVREGDPRSRGVGQEGGREVRSLSHTRCTRGVGGTG
uniref:DNA primase n=1 Tax=Leptospirillum sp. Group II '5-way CG' TaxID=419541 RepID=B6ASH0_9BACT|nr:MAG: DNA primase [Leptospirillum sp. Group II '5-way CG']